jgi:hypothetical protein
MNKPTKIEFAPGCFDSFEGTQEELDELMNEIKTMIETGELFEKSEPVDFDELIETDPEYAEKLLLALSDIPTSTRKLQ